jgi:hypothetical protein
MATVAMVLSLSSAAADLTSHALALNVSEDITAANTSGIAKIKIGQTAANTSTEILYTASDYTGPVYLYLLNTETTAGNNIYIYDDTSTGSPVIAKLGPGNVGLIPLGGDKTIRAYSDTTADFVLEYMVFGTQA